MTSTNPLQFIYLINLSPCHLLGVITARHENLHNVHQAPERVLLVQEEEGDGGYPVEPLAILYIRVMQAVGKENTA